VLGLPLTLRNMMLKRVEIWMMMMMYINFGDGLCWFIFCATV
jgi:hypothetical protein